MPTYRALRVTKTDAAPALEWVDVEERPLGTGEVRIGIAYSDVNYKDGLALVTGSTLRRPQLVAGIDLVGTITESAAEGWSAGDRVTVNGHGIGESVDGGYAEQAVLPARMLTRIPDGLSDWEAAAIGTAGFTSALSVAALQTAALPEGEVAVSGASGGVGSLGIMLGAKVLGNPLVAVTGRREHADWLRRLGAADVVGREVLDHDPRPLESERWAGGMDGVGGRMLASMLAQTRWGGTVAAYGMAAGTAMTGTVMPFILRGVRLQGINSVDAPDGYRESAWALLDAHLDRDALLESTTEVGRDDIVDVAHRILAGAVRGRTVVRIA